MTRSSGNKGFSLIELLVVMAVITMLASVGYPMYMKAKGSANTVACKAGLRGMARAIAMYHASFGGWLPRFDGAGNTSKDGKDVEWKMILSTFMGEYSFDDYRKNKVPLHKAFTDPTRGDGEGVYMASKGQLIAPTVMGKVNTSNQGYYDEAVRKAAERKWEALNNRKPSTDADAKAIRELAKQIALSGGAGGELLRSINIQEFKYLPQAAIIGPSIDSKLHFAYTDGDDNPKSKKLGAIDYRHRGNIANILFLDGHVDEYVKDNLEDNTSLVDRWNIRHFRETGLK